MTNLKLMLCAGSAVVGLAFATAAFADDQTSTPPAAPAATPAAPAPTPMANPAISGPINAHPHPATGDGGPSGTGAVDGVLSGGGLWQSKPSFDAFGVQNKSGGADIT